jgi:hypothetical protein
MENPDLGGMAVMSERGQQTRPARKESDAEADMKRKMKGYLKDLLEEVEAGESSLFLNYLNFVASFQPYSYHNTILVMLQRPDATLVLSGADATRRGLKLREDAQAPIYIWAPTFGKNRGGATGGREGWQKRNPLHLYRTAMGLEPKDIASSFRVSAFTVNLWEQGAFIPYPKYLNSIKTVLEGEFQGPSPAFPDADMNKAWEKLRASAEKGDPKWLESAWKNWKEESPSVASTPVRDYHLTKVYDVSDFEPASPVAVLPSRTMPLGQAPSTIVDAVTRALEGQGIKYDSLLEDAAAKARPSQGKLDRVARIDAAADETHGLLSVLHEWAERKLAAGTPDLEPAELLLRAEVVTYIVSRHLGVPNPYSADLVQYWKGKIQALPTERQKTKALKDMMKTVTRVADDLVGTVDLEMDLTRNQQEKHPPKETAGSGEMVDPDGDDNMLIL